jgi:hypothetical protein
MSEDSAEPVRRPSIGDVTESRNSLTVNHIGSNLIAPEVQSKSTIVDSGAASRLGSQAAITVTSVVRDNPNSTS